MDCQKRLISVITPCYNSGAFVAKLLDSVLMQNYPSVEMIAVDDDSSDNTAQVIKSYISRFESRGYTLRYIHQPHGGQSAAINRALKIITGEFLVWPDSDDFYSGPESLGKLAGALKDSPEDVALARCLPAYVDGQDRELSSGNGVPRYINPNKQWLFRDALWGQNGFWYLSGGYMVKMRCLDECIPGREIACAVNAGQSWQLLLPLLHRYRCLTVKEKLITVLVRKDSHSRNFFNTYKTVMQKHRDFEYVLLATLEKIQGIDDNAKEMLIEEIGHYYSRQYALASLRFRFHIPLAICNKLMRLKDIYDSYRRKN